MLMHREIFHNSYSLLIDLFFSHTVIYMKVKRESALTKQSKLSLKNPRKFCLGRFIHSVIKTL